MAYEFWRQGGVFGIASPYKILYKIERTFYNDFIATECGSDWRGSW
nr:MAG TPA: hypothetical protein [Bacteriophage sp.]